MSRYSDDHEPQGTAGLPILDMIKKSGCTNIAIVVTRYFGGILLGTGGLVHAYTRAAKEAMATAEIVTFKMHSMYKVNCSYSDYNKLIAWIEDNGIKTEDAQFTDRTEFVCVIKNDQTDFFLLYILPDPFKCTFFES